MAIDKVDSMVRPNPVQSHAERKRKRQRKDSKFRPPESQPDSPSSSTKRQGNIDELA